jgi:uncharacterized SAM-binding protein YcdF (DUF218 family)
MFILKKLIAPFALPPGIFVVFLVLAGFWALRRKNRPAACISLVCAVFFWTFSISPTSDLLMGGLEKGLVIPSDIEADVILMLGGSIYEKSPDLSGQGAPGPDTMMRLVTAARLHHRLGGIPIVVSGGKVFSAGAPIAPIAKRFLVDLGIPPDAVILEDRSRDTYENALYCKSICEQRGFKKPLMVTSGYHIKRALLCFNKVGLTVTPFPCALTTWPDNKYGWQHVLPSAGALYATSKACHEWIGLVYTRLAH